MQKKAIGIVGIQPMPTKLIGNTGNLVFTNAAISAIDSQTKMIGFSFDPKIANKELSAVVIPAANWLNNKADWSDVSQRIEDLDIPITVMGIGLQGNLDLGPPLVSNSAMELVRLLSQKSETIGVRGEYTRNWLIEQGISNVDTVGCPSMHLSQPQMAKNSEGIAVQGTKFRVGGKKYSESFQLNFYRLAAKENLDIVFQSESEELSLLDGSGLFLNWSASKRAAILGEYGEDNFEELIRFLKMKGKYFLSVDAWKKYLASKSGLYGSRIHGAILAMNSGVPTVLVPHDSRTLEMAEYYSMPTISIEEARSVNSLEDIQELLSQESSQKKMSAISEVRRVNASAFRSFLRMNNLKPNTHTILS